MSLVRPDSPDHLLSPIISSTYHQPDQHPPYINPQSQIPIINNAYLSRVGVRRRSVNPLIPPYITGFCQPNGSSLLEDGDSLFLSMFFLAGDYMKDNWGAFKGVLIRVGVIVV
jgi:hypothetical protein